MIDTDNVLRYKLCITKVIYPTTIATQEVSAATYDGAPVLSHSHMECP